MAPGCHRCRGDHKTSINTLRLQTTQFLKSANDACRETGLFVVLGGTKEGAVQGEFTFNPHAQRAPPSPSPWMVFVKRVTTTCHRASWKETIKWLCVVCLKLVPNLTPYLSHTIPLNLIPPAKKGNAARGNGGKRKVAIDSEERVINAVGVSSVCGKCRSRSGELSSALSHLPAWTQWERIKISSVPLSQSADSPPTAFHCL